MSELGERISFARQLGHVEGRINALERKVDVFEQRIESKLGTFIGALMAVLKWLIDHAVLRLSGGP